MADEVDKHLQEKAAGKPPNEFIERLHQEGYTIIESMVIVRKVYDLPLANTKQLVSSHPVWRSVVESAEPLHDELEEIANDE